MIGRTHFARFLVESGEVKTSPPCFANIWSRASPAMCRTSGPNWPMRWAGFCAAGGVAVIAHPGRYDIGRQLQEELVQDFKAVGGEAIEVVSASHTLDQTHKFALLAARAWSCWPAPAATFMPRRRRPRRGAHPGFAASVSWCGAASPAARHARGGQLKTIMSQLFHIHPENPQARLIREAVKIIQQGGVIAYPTDSCYALAAIWRTSGRWSASWPSANWTCATISPWCAVTCPSWAAARGTTPNTGC